MHYRTKTTHNTRRRRGFSLVELMVVIIIIGVLGGIVGVNVVNRVKQARQTAAKQQIAVFKNALKQYKFDTGTYPDTLDALIVPPQDETKWDGPYLEEDVSVVPLDPWGNPYDYYYPGEYGPFDIISYGADNAEGGEGEDADIYSWELGSGADTQTQ